MREAIGGTWLMQIIIIFMLTFVAFLALTLNFTKAYKIKNELLTIIEEREGLTGGSKGSIALINNYLEKNGYKVLRACPEGSYGATNLNSTYSTDLELVGSGYREKKYYYCVTKYKAKSTNYDTKVYYRVAISFKFNLPVIGDLFSFEASGNTEDIAIPQDSKTYKSI